jgi:hypothetical protein
LWCCGRAFGSRWNKDVSCGYWDEPTASCGAPWHKELQMDSFDFDINAKRTRIPNEKLLESLQKFAVMNNNQYFSTTQFDNWKDKIAHSSTIAERFGSWNRALRIIGIEGGHERKYSAEELMDNLENIWKQLGYPPGKRQLSKMGRRISERPYINQWASVRNACELLSQFHKGKLSRDELLRGSKDDKTRKTVPDKIRFAVLKRDRFTCVKCGQSPAKGNDVELEIDHINPVSKGGDNDISNLQTLCKRCNQGKKDRT